MGFIPLIIDSVAGYAPRDGKLFSVLSLPLGVESVLQHALTLLADLQPKTVLVLPAAGGTRSIHDEVDRCQAVRLTNQDQLDLIIEELDSSDCFLVLDTKSWPVAWPVPHEICESGREYRGATHVIAIGSRSDRAIERIDCDEDGQIRRVRRLYATSNWPEVAGHSIAYSLVPARSLLGVRFDSLASLRQELAIRGVLSRDKPMPSEVMDLAQTSGYLSYSERTVVRYLKGKRPAGSSGQRAGLIVGEGCRIASSARLVPPIVVRDGAVIGENVTIVGPAVIGPNGQVLDGAVVAQSVVLADAIVPERSIVRHQVYPHPPAEAGNRQLGDPTQGQPQRNAEWTCGSGRFTSEARARRRRISMSLKRFSDVLISASALITLSPLLLLVSLLIWLDSRGPILFGHLRERRDGKEFKCLKFRTMVPDADSRQQDLVEANQVDGPQFKLENDPRVTRVGRWLRKTNLDELPQLINVLVGHMSLVGPRPSPFRENQICVAWRKGRLSVRPGITGLWQICRATDRSQGDFHEWIYYDLTYVKHFSFWLDLKILLATFLTLGGHRRVPPSWMIGCLDGHGRQSRGREAA